MFGGKIKRESASVMSEVRDSSSKSNPFIDTYFLKPVKLSRFVEQTLRMSQQVKDAMRKEQRRKSLKHL